MLVKSDLLKLPFGEYKIKDNNWVYSLIKKLMYGKELIYTIKNIETEECFNLFENSIYKDITHISAITQICGFSFVSRDVEYMFRNINFVPRGSFDVFEEACKRLEKTDICENCGCSGASWVIDPYDLDVNGEENLVYICDNCYELYEDDI